MLGSATGRVQVCPSLVWNVMVRFSRSMPTMVLEPKVVAATLVSTVVVNRQSRPIASMAILNPISAPPCDRMNRVMVEDQQADGPSLSVGHFVDVPCFSFLTPQKVCHTARREKYENVQR